MRVINSILWSLPPWVHEIILNLTGCRMVLFHNPDDAIPFYGSARRLVWTKKYPLRNGKNDYWMQE